MWKISQVTPLPFQSADVAGHFGVSGVTVGNIRPHSISPGGIYCAGTCTYTVTVPVKKTVSRGFVLRNTTPSLPNASWVLEPAIPLPMGWQGMSIRGVNDNGDFCGFYVASSEPVPGPDVGRAYIWLAGSPTPIELSLPPSNPVTYGSVAAIDNSLRFTGTHRDQTVTPYKAQLRPDQTVDSLVYAEYPSLSGIGSFNVFDQYLFSATSNGNTAEFVHLGYDLLGYPLHRNISDSFVSILPSGAVLNLLGLNQRTEIVGFYSQPNNLPSPGDSDFHGAFCRVDPSGVFDRLLWNHPSASLNSPIDTRLFSISDAGTVVGTYDRNHPFSLAATYEADQPIPPEAWWNPPHAPWWSGGIDRRRLERLLALARMRQWPPPFPAPSPYHGIDERVNIAKAMELHEMIQALDGNEFRVELETILFRYLHEEIDRMKEAGKRSD